MTARVRRRVNSQGLKLAKHVLENAGISVRDEVEVIPRRGQILIRKVAKPRFNLAEMVCRIPERYKPSEESFGRPVGREEW